MRTAKEWKKIYTDSEFYRTNIYEGHDLGVRCTADGTTFLLWSPCAESIILYLYKDGNSGNAYRKISMTRKEKGVWEYYTNQELHGIYYDYRVTIDGVTGRTADPYAKACGINGQRSMVVNLSKTNPEGWEEDQIPEKSEENIIYELHVKEFSWDSAGGFPEEYRGKYKAFLCDNTTLNSDGVHKTGKLLLEGFGRNSHTNYANV
ncbi:MAG: hypothetical protein V8S08_06030 [Lachnoclostridium sp.]